YMRQGIQLPERACIFDVGANIGMFTLFASEQSPRSTIYAFEPCASLFEKLQENAAQCEAVVKAFHFGLSDHDGLANFTFYPRYSMMSCLSEYANPDVEIDVIKRTLYNEQAMGSEIAGSLLTQADELLAGRFDGGVETARLRRLSDVMREQRIEWIDLLKIDVQ